MFAKLFGLDKLSMYFIIGLIALIAMIVVPNLDQISEKLGFDTVASLKKDVEIEKNNVEVVAKTNENLTNTLEVIKKSNELVPEIIAEGNESVLVVAKKIKEVKTKQEVAIAKKPDMTDKENAVLVIDGIWEVYCTTFKCK